MLVLSEDWNPSSCEGDVCKQACASNPHCTPPFGAFTVYSLIASNSSGAQGLEQSIHERTNCSGPPFDAAAFSQNYQSGALGCIFANSEGANQDLWADLWELNGRCTGLPVVTFYSFLLSHYNGRNVNDALVRNGSFSAPAVDRNALVEALRKQWNVTTWVTCNPATRTLAFVSICFPKPRRLPDGTYSGIDPNSPPMDCPWDPMKDYGTWDDLAGGLPCNGTLLIQPGIAPPEECKTYFPNLLPNGQEGSSDSLSAGAIAGIVVGCVTAVALLALLAAAALRHRAARSSQVGLEFDSAKASEFDLEAITGRATVATSGGRSSVSGASQGLTKSLEGEDDVVLSYLRILSGRRLRAAAEEAAAGDAGGDGTPVSAGALRSEASAGGPLGLPSGPSSPTQPEGSTASVAARRFSSTDSQLWEVDFAQLELIRTIGEGAFGRVYLGEWNSTMVAVKLLVDLEEGQVTDTASLVAALAQPSPLLSRLREEADIMFSLRHPNCVQLMGVCSIPPCLVCEFCARGSLAFCLAEGRRNPQVASLLTWRRRLGMAYDATKGMLYLHSRSPPIIHRDLKSPNLLVDKDWNVKVADFNLSREEGDLHLKSTDEAMNPRWLAPEVLQGSPATPASDAFSFGVVLWELLTWELPWHTDGAADSYWQIVAKLTVGERLGAPPAEELPGPHRLPPELHQQYLQLMHDCWVEDPAARPTFAAIASRLREIIRALIAPLGATLPPTPKSASPMTPVDRPS